jgi:hypothetical protein
VEKINKSNVTIYCADPSLIGSKLFSFFPELKQTEPMGQNGQAKGMMLKFPFGSIECHFLSGDDLSDHLLSLKQYARSIFERSENDFVYLAARISEVRLGIGMNISPSFETEERLLKFVMNFNECLNGLIFIENDLLDYDCENLLKPTARI